MLFNFNLLLRDFYSNVLIVLVFFRAHVKNILFLSKRSITQTALIETKINSKIVTW